MYQEQILRLIQNNIKMKFIKVFNVIVFLLLSGSLVAQNNSKDSLIFDWQKSCLLYLNQVIVKNQEKNDTLLTDQLIQKQEELRDIKNCRNYLNLESCKIIKQSEKSFFATRWIFGEQLRVENSILSYKQGSYYLYTSIDDGPYDKVEINKSKFQSVDNLFDRLIAESCLLYEDNMFIVSKFNDNFALISSKVFPIICNSQLEEISTVLRSR
jgi:hypothetical protein